MQFWIIFSILRAMNCVNALVSYERKNTDTGKSRLFHIRIHKVGWVGVLPLFWVEAMGRGLGVVCFFSEEAGEGRPTSKKGQRFDERKMFQPSLRISKGVGGGAALILSGTTRGEGGDF